MEMIGKVLSREELEECICTSCAMLRFASVWTTVVF
jgi:hypothetical protein